MDTERMRRTEGSGIQIDRSWYKTGNRFKTLLRQTPRKHIFQVSTLGTGVKVKKRLENSNTVDELRAVGGETGPLSQGAVKSPLEAYSFKESVLESNGKKDKRHQKS